MQRIRGPYRRRSKCFLSGCLRNACVTPVLPRRLLHKVRADVLLVTVDWHWVFVRNAYASHPHSYPAFFLSIIVPSLPQDSCYRRYAFFRNFAPLLVAGFFTTSRALRTQTIQLKNADIHAAIGFRPTNPVFEVLDDVMA